MNRVMLQRSIIQLLPLPYATPVLVGVDDADECGFSFIPGLLIDSRRDFRSCRVLVRGQIASVPTHCVRAA